MSMRIISLKRAWETKENFHVMSQWLLKQRALTIFSENCSEDTLHKFNTHLLFNHLLQIILYLEPHALFCYFCFIFQLVTQLNDPTWLYK